MEHYEQYMQEEISKEKFCAVQDIENRQKRFLFRLQRVRLPVKSNIPGSVRFFLLEGGIFRSARL